MIFSKLKDDLPMIHKIHFTKSQFLTMGIPSAIHAYWDIPRFWVYWKYKIVKIDRISDKGQICGQKTNNSPCLQASKAFWKRLKENGRMVIYILFIFYFFKLYFTRWNEQSTPLQRLIFRNQSKRSHLPARQRTCGIGFIRNLITIQSMIRFNKLLAFIFQTFVFLWNFSMEWAEPGKGILFQKPE